jgi:histidinol-phosphatase (PHP family)
MPWSNYHSHTNFSDGSDNPPAYIEEALRQGLFVYGFSCHAPVPFETDWCMKREKLDSYFGEIKKLKEKYAPLIKVLIGLEVDYIPGMVSPSDQLFRNSPLDYVIGSVHFVDFFPDGTPWGIDMSADVFKKGLEQIWKADIKKAVRLYYKLVRELINHSNPDIIGHFDKIRMFNEGSLYFSEDEKWYREEIYKSMEVIRAAGCLMEVNTRGIYRGYTKEPYPSLWILKEAAKMGIPIILSSDAHKPHEITGKFSETSVILKEAGYNELYNWIDDSWQPVPYNENGITLM